MFGALAVFVSDEVPRRRGSLFAQDLGGCCPQIHSGCRTGLWNSVFFPLAQKNNSKKEIWRESPTKRSYFTRCHIIPQDISRHFPSQCQFDHALLPVTTSDYQLNQLDQNLSETTAFFEHKCDAGSLAAIPAFKIL